MYFLTLHWALFRFRIFPTIIQDEERVTDADSCIIYTRLLVYLRFSLALIKLYLLNPLFISKFDTI